MMNVLFSFSRVTALVGCVIVRASLWRIHMLGDWSTAPRLSCILSPLSCWMLCSNYFRFSTWAQLVPRVLPSRCTVPQLRRSEVLSSSPYHALTDAIANEHLARSARRRFDPLRLPPSPFAPAPGKVVRSSIASQNSRAASRTIVNWVSAYVSEYEQSRQS